MVKVSHRRTYVPREGLAIAGENYADTHELAGSSVHKLAEYNLHYRTLVRCETGIEHVKAIAGRRPEPPQMWQESLEEVIWSGVVVEYARAFKPDGGGQPLPAGQVFTAKADLVRHEFWMAQRSKHIAHDVNGWRHSRVGVVLDEGGRAKGLLCSVQQAIVKPEEINDLQRLTRLAIEWLMPKCQQLEAEILRDCLATDPAVLLSLPLMRADPHDGPVDAARRQSNRPKHGN